MQNIPGKIKRVICELWLFHELRNSTRPDLNNSSRSHCSFCYIGPLLPNRDNGFSARRPLKKPSTVQIPTEYVYFTIKTSSRTPARYV